MRAAQSVEYNPRMFETIQTAPPDAILGLSAAFRVDENPDKINLGVGIYKDDSGNTPVMRAVKEAERRLLASETSKAYKPIGGDPAYTAAARALVLGGDSALIESGRAVTVASPGGTGGLRVVGDFLKQNRPDATVWLSTPTWANHAAIYRAAGVPTRVYPYYDAERNALDADAMLAGLAEVAAGDVVLLHGCCHNPTGVDPDLDTWRAIAETLARVGAVPLIDFAYQGFGAGLTEDAAGLYAILERCDEAFICASFSKNFGLYNERVGALTVVASQADHAQAVLSQIRICIRRNYSNPPAHGDSVVQTILTDDELRAMWRTELAEMRTRINGVRADFAAELDRRGIALNKNGNGFIIVQNGMFSFSGLSKERVTRLREEFSIYIVGSGRINVAGITSGNMARLCDCLGKVLS